MCVCVRVCVRMSSKHYSELAAVRTPMWWHLHRSQQFKYTLDSTRMDLIKARDDTVDKHLVRTRSKHTLMFTMPISFNVRVTYVYVQVCVSVFAVGAVYAEFLCCSYIFHCRYKFSLFYALAFFLCEISLCNFVTIRHYSCQSSFLIFPIKLIPTLRRKTLSRSQCHEFALLYRPQPISALLHQKSKNFLNIHSRTQS